MSISSTSKTEDEVLYDESGKGKFKSLEVNMVPRIRVMNIVKRRQVTRIEEKPLVTANNNITGRSHLLSATNVDKRVILQSIAE